MLRRDGYALPFFAMHAGPEQAPHICACAGIHGDEPAGVEAMVTYLEETDHRASDVRLTVFPCINPTGYIANARRNDIGFDLNRTFGQDPGPQETELVRQALAGKRFGCALDLHEDADARGFYLYEHVRDEGARLGPQIVSAVASSGMPINDSPDVEGRRLVNGCVEPAEERVSPTVGFLSIYLFDRHTDHTLNPESPGCLPLPARVTMHLTTLRAALAALAGGAARSDTRR